ncbi:L,D-transpeptidase family protein [Alicyclobacillus dauci]|uniref:L,D-transpeptidase family protein n=1 Tax=Alicyclobacillus dauci TaxID=1475485 RepID=A0ABY6Z1W6_9BACL|nr:L,D-transpeptidase family protein [Alicyclobacillus dauci]WAH36498.1 L,D-transpeptidase family protein [Alicyclobacillus dauci]
MKSFRGLRMITLSFCMVAVSALVGCTPITSLTDRSQVTTHAISDVTNTATANSTSSASANGGASSQTTTSNGTGSTGTASSPAKVTVITPPAPPLVQLGNRSAAARYLNESLTLLGYMPVQFTPTTSTDTATAMSQLAVNAENLKFTPLDGTYTWRDKETTQQIGSLWNSNTANVITEGALMHFQADHHIAVDGVAGPSVWKALQSALSTHEVSKAPYVFVTVDERPTEVLKVWVGGQVAVRTLANTGIAQSPTSIGTWPIYLRFQTQEMKGRTPWGTTYDDPGVPYVNYFHGGDAVHGFPRASYGYPQSMGCVEIPVSTAKQVFNIVTYGTLVTVRK